MLEIVDYTEDKKEYIKTLNVEWLQKYATVEPHDIVQLSDPQAEIIDKGGLIFYAKVQDEIIGTATLMKKDAVTYELSKMGVTDAYQGQGIGNKLMEHCIAKATELQAQKLILFSHTKLGPAIHLYKKYGFVEVPLGDTIYARANIKMEKKL